MRELKLKFQHRVRFNLPLFRYKTPRFDYAIKHIVWGIGKRHAEEIGRVPKLIWLYWDEVEISSSTVLICVNQVRKLYPDYEVQLLNRETVSEHLPNFPNDVWEKSANFVSDLIRLMLLEKYGGIYMDATLLISRRLDWAIAQREKDGAEAVLYYTDENTVESAFPMVETWFIVAATNSTFIKDWREEYQKCITSPDPQNYYNGNDVFSLDKFPLEKSYYLSYLSGQIVMRRRQDYRLSLFRAEDDAFLYSLSFKRKWSEIAMAEILLINKKPNPLPHAVKIIRFARRRLDLYIRIGFYKKQSWLGELLHNDRLEQRS